MVHSKANSDFRYSHLSEKEPMCPFSLGDETPHSQECLQAEGCQNLPSLHQQTITHLAEADQIGTSILQVSAIPIFSFLSITISTASSLLILP